MPWFGQGGKKGKAGNTELQIQRSKQIEALRRGNLGYLDYYPRLSETSYHFVPLQIKMSYHSWRLHTT